MMAASIRLCPGSADQYGSLGNSLLGSDLVTKLTFTCELRGAPTAIAEPNDTEFLVSQFLFQCLGGGEHVWASFLLAVATSPRRKVKSRLFLGTVECIGCDDLTIKAGPESQSPNLSDLSNRVGETHKSGI